MQFVILRIPRYEENASASRAFSFAANCCLLRHPVPRIAKALRDSEPPAIRLRTKYHVARFPFFIGSCTFPGDMTSTSTHRRTFIRSCILPGDMSSTKTHRRNESFERKYIWPPFCPHRLLARAAMLPPRSGFPGSAFTVINVYV